MANLRDFIDGRLDLCVCFQRKTRSPDNKERLSVIPYMLASPPLPLFPSYAVCLPDTQAKQCLKCFEKYHLRVQSYFITLGELLMIICFNRKNKALGMGSNSTSDLCAQEEKVDTHRLTTQKFFNRDGKFTETQTFILLTLKRSSYDPSWLLVWEVVSSPRLREGLLMRGLLVRTLSLACLIKMQHELRTVW